MTLNPIDVVRKAREQWAKSLILMRSGVQIHPSAKVKYTKISSHPFKQLVIGQGSIIECSIVAERPDALVTIGTNTYIGNSTLIAATAILIGDDVLISWGCTIVDHHSHSTKWDERRSDVTDWYSGKKNWKNVRSAQVRIENKAWIGFNSIILAGITIGEGAVVGCGSIVTRDVPAYTVAAGNPARVVKKL